MEVEKDAAFVGSACGVATIFTVAGDGGIAGAVYTPACVIVPHELAAHPTPATLQEIARFGFEFAGGVSVAAYVADVPAFTDLGPTTKSENMLVRPIAAVAILEVSATLIAIKLALAGVGRIPGAVYVPVESTVPHAAPEHPLPARIQVTVRFGLPAESTAATNDCAAPNSTEVDWGEIETEMSLVTVACALEFLVLSSTLVAITETELGAGKLAGAVYTPPALIVPTAASPPEIPFTLQITAEFVALLTVAVKVCCSPNRTVATDGATDTVMLEGGCDGPVPTTPQPRIDATRSNSGQQYNSG
jgi:hypothetical protein